MKIKSLFLLVALVLPMAPALVRRQGAPSLMPLVVCHVDQAPQMLVPAYLLPMGMAAASTTDPPTTSSSPGDALLLVMPDPPSFVPPSRSVASLSGLPF